MEPINFTGACSSICRTRALDADPYGFSERRPKSSILLAFHSGGPVIIPHLYNGHDRTFFFADYEGNRRTTAVAQQLEVPTAAERTATLADSISPVKHHWLPIPATNISPHREGLLAYLPLPNVTGQSGYNYENFQSTPARTDGADLRVDQTISAKQSAYARFTRKNITEDSANPFLPNDSESIHNRSLLISDTYTITPTLLNEFRYGFTNVTTSVDFPIQGSDALAQLDLTGVNISQHPTTHAFPTFNFGAGTGLTPIGPGQSGHHAIEDDAVQRQSHLHSRQAHDQGRHRCPPRTVLRSGKLRPGVRFGRFRRLHLSANFTGNAFGDFLEGAPTTLNFAVSSPDVGERQPSSASSRRTNFS